jgi:hypothetical protein
MFLVRPIILAGPFPNQLPIGWTILDNLFVLNGTVFVVTDYPDSIPDLITITSTGVEIHNSKEDIDSRTPGDREMRVVSPNQAESLFGSSAESIDGVTVSDECRRNACRSNSHDTPVDCQ